MGQTKIAHHLTECSEKAQSPPLRCPAEDAWLEISHEEASDTKSRNSNKVSLIMPTHWHKRSKNYSRLEMTERTKWNMWFWTGCVCCKEHHQDHEKTQIESKTYMTLMYQCWFSDFKLKSGYLGEYPHFRRHTVNNSGKGCIDQQCTLKWFKRRRGFFVLYLCFLVRDCFKLYIFKLYKA